METELTSQLGRMAQPNLDLEFYHERINLMPKDEWFTPTNNDFEDYSICAHLYEMNLIQRKTRPLWHNGNFRGATIYFKINNDLIYS